MNQQQDVLLLKYIEKAGKKYMEICREGISLLRTLKNKKLRIVFNVMQQPHDISQFNSQFLGDTQKSEKIADYEEGGLTISRNFRFLSDNRVIIFMNAFERKGERPKLMILGYLAASVFFYHKNDEIFSTDSHLTQILKQFGKLLKFTNIDHLNKVMKFKTGYVKNPYFLCLLYNKKSTQLNDQFKQFYKYNSKGQQDLNQAVDTLINFFPERSSISINQLQGNSIRKIGQQYEKSIVGRSIFNFQFTSNSIENLCFELCELYNKDQKINLLDMFNKIIENQKIRIYDISQSQYTECLKNNFFRGGKIDFQTTSCESILPISSSKLEVQHQKIRKQIVNESIERGTNCMSLSEYELVYRKIQQIFQKDLNKLRQINQQKAQEHCSECFTVLTESQPPQNLGKSEQIQQIFNLIKNKIQLYKGQCEELLEDDSLSITYNYHLTNLINRELEAIEKTSMNAMQSLELNLIRKNTELQELKYNYKVKEVEQKKLQYEYELQSDVINEYKIKYLKENDKIVDEKHLYNKSINQLRKKVQQLEEQVQDKTLEIDELNDVVERYEGLSDKEKNKLKFSKEINEHIKEINIKVNNLYPFIQQVKNLESIYEDFRKKITEERDKIIEEREKIHNELYQKDAQINRVTEQKKMLTGIINEAKQSVSVYKKVEQTFKQSISDLQNNYTRVNCLLAQTQSQLEEYKKALKLIVDQCLKGKVNESLFKFYKVLQKCDLKQILMPLFKK